MSEEIMYVDAPEDISEGLMVGEIMPDFLPSPEQLERKKPRVGSGLPVTRTPLPRKKLRKVRQG
jgi:hypothetical protein